MLRSMAPDMASAVISLCRIHGARALELVSETNGDALPRLNGLFSPTYFKDVEDLHKFYLGSAAIMLSQYKAFSGSAGGYKSVLADLYDLPDSMAAAAAQQIETYDPLVRSQTDAAEVKIGYLSMLADALKEGTRRVANWTLDRLGVPFKFDQSQKRDYDAVYEICTLGEYVEKFAGRTRMMTTQLAIAKSTGLFAKAGMGDTFEEGDPVTDLVSAINMFMRNKLPDGVMGKFASGQDYGRTVSAQKVAAASGAEGQGDPGMAAIADQISTGSLDIPATAMAMTKGNPLVSHLAESYQSAVGDLEARNSTYTHLCNALGQEVGDAWMSGDIESLVSELGDIMDTETTGDPELDEAIAHEVIEAVDSEGGTDAEKGGWFTKARIRANMRKAARRAGRASNRNRLRSAKQLARRDWDSDNSTQANEEEMYAQVAPGFDGGAVPSDDGSGGLDMSQFT